MTMRALVLALALGLGSSAVAGPFGDHCGRMVALSFVVVMNRSCNEYYRLTAHGLDVDRQRMSQIMSPAWMECMDESNAAMRAVNAGANSFKGDEHKMFCKMAAKIINDELGDVVEQR